MNYSVMNIYEEYIESVIQLAKDAAYDDRYEEAKRLLEGALMEEPGYAKVHARLGDLYHYDLENKAMAARHYELAIKFYPAYQEVYQDLVTLYQDERNYVKLKRLLKKATAVKTLDPVFLYEKLGMADEAQGHFKEAIAWYRKGLLESLNNADTTELKKHIRRNRYKRFKLRRKRKIEAI